MRKSPDVSLTPEQVRAFQQEVRAFFRQHARAFPWRETRDPYHILVSEVMLQQTQADRVVPKYEAFLERFPDVHALARAPRAAVITAWQGLGYNRRALMLHESAREIVATCNGCVPDQVEDLQRLPGIGPYTAAAVRVFAFNRSEVFVETNIRAVYIQRFFAGQGPVSDAQLLPLVRQTLPRCNPRRWYNALMDYGAILKQRFGNPTRRSSHYVRQAPFRGSDREIRGAVIRHLSGSSKKVRLQDLLDGLEAAPARVLPIIGQLEREGFLQRRGDWLQLARM